MNTEVQSMDIAEFLITNPKYYEILERAVAAEERLDKDPLRANLGWEWHDAQAYPASLVKLVVSGIIKVQYKSNSGTMYRIIDRQAVKQALKKSR
jgi:hypothetical protein